MRPELLWNARLLMERLAQDLRNRYRLSKVRKTIASKLTLDHIDTLELIEATRIIKPGVIYDIGACAGSWALLAKACLPEAKIHAFEPLAVHVEDFRNKMKDIPDIKLHNIALGARTAICDIHITNRTDSSSLLEPTEENARQWGVVKKTEQKIKIIPLDQYVSENELPLPDLLKLDVQGYELEVLRGAENCLSHARWVISEISFVEYYKEQPLFCDIGAFLREQGYYLYALGVNTSLGKKLTQTDALFARKF